MAALAAAREAPLSHDNNPYAKALEGLRLDDPVKAFFDFCREREAIRIRREKGWRTHHFKLQGGPSALGKIYVDIKFKVPSLA